MTIGERDACTENERCQASFHFWRCPRYEHGEPHVSQKVELDETIPAQTVAAGEHLSVACVLVGMKKGPETHLSWCGRNVEGEWAFTDAGHAALSARKASGPHPCAKCVKEIVGALKTEAAERASECTCDDPVGDRDPACPSHGCTCSSVAAHLINSTGCRFNDPPEERK